MTIKDANLTVQVANMCTQIVNFRVYLCRARRDIPATQVLGEVVNSTLPNTSGYLYGGFSDNNISPEPYSPATTLFQNPYFCSRHKILKVRMFQLAPGENKDLSIAWNRPRTINSEVVALTDFSMMRGAQFFVIQHWGALGSIATGQVGEGNVSYTRTEISFTSKRRYNYQQVSPSRTYMFNQNNLPVITGTLNFVNPDTDAIITEAVV